jgi:hypothetical protein
MDDLESFTTKEIDVPLTGGRIVLRMKWEPQLLARKREGTSLIGSTTRILSSGTNIAGDVVGLGVGAGGKVLTGGTKLVGGGTRMVGGAINGGIGAIGRGFGKIGGHNKKASEASVGPVSPTSSTGPISEQHTLNTQELQQSVIGSITSSESTSGRRSMAEESE